MILRIIDRGMDRSTYEELRKRLDIDHTHPLGLIMHGASEADGKMKVAQIWESEWYAARFDEEILGPALKEMGVVGDPQVAVYPLEHLVTP